MTEHLHFHFSLSCIGGGNGNPLQYSCLENSMDGGAWWAAVHGVAKSRTRLKRLSGSSSFTNILFKHNFLKDTFQRHPCITKQTISVYIVSDVTVILTAVRLHFMSKTVSKGLK